MAYGEVLAELRKDKGLKQEDIAKLIDVTPTTVSNYELGLNYLTVGNLIKLADFFDVSCDLLLDRTRYRLSWETLSKGLEADGKVISFQGLFEKMNSLSMEDRKMIIRIIDSLLISERIKRK